jgi:hypothetical protein
MRRLVQVSAAAVITAALVAGVAHATPPLPGQVNIGGEALRFSEASPDFGPEELSQRTAFEHATATKEPAARAAAFEAFLKAYPDSKARRRAMLQLVSAYGLAGDVAGLTAAGQRLATAYPNDPPALAILVDSERRAAAAAKDAATTRQLADEAAGYAAKGLAALPGWQRPERMSAAAGAASRAYAEAVFEKALGYAALQGHDYLAARPHLARAVALQADDWSALELLAAADLLGKPMEPKGFWYAAKAAALAKAEKNETAAGEIDGFARKAYASYHGGEDGWDQIAAAAATQSAPPAGFAVAHATTPAELVVQAVQQTDPAKMGFPDWEAVLSFADASPENKAAADKVWAAIQAVQQGGTVKLRLPARVIAATPSSIDAAVSEDNRGSGTADVHAALAQPLASPPKPGDEVQISGVLDGYSLHPFAFHMAGARVEK